MGSESVLDLSFERLKDVIAAMGVPAFRAGQVFEWLHVKNVQTFDEMSNLPAKLRAEFAQNWRIDIPNVQERREATDGTEKLLLRLSDNCNVETVLMHYKYGLSVCVSSQVGCSMGCKFCASTQAGLSRNLTAGEMLGQVYAAARAAKQRVGHVVLMGIGEPLQNIDNVVSFIKLLTDEKGYNLAGRGISLSTCGIVDGIDELAKYKLPLTLSVSLHAANDKKRSALMPVNNKWPIAQLLDACQRYYKITRRRISYEYALFAGVNDTNEDADELGRVLCGRNAHVNLIRANEVKGSSFKPSTKERTNAFAARIEDTGVQVTVRRRLGGGIDAACGQLRINKMDMVHKMYPKGENSAGR